MSLIKNISLTVLSLSLSGFALAANSMDTRMSDLEKQMKEIRVENSMGTMGITTATSRAEVDGTGFFIVGGPIYQQAVVCGTEFTFTDDDPVASLPVKGRVKDINFEWDWGLNVGVGYYAEHDAWDVYLHYTWFDSSGSRSVSGGLNGSVALLRADPDLTGSLVTHAQIAKSQFDADYNILNLELGRAYFISGRLSLRPHIGLQSTWIDLQQIIRYSGGSQLSVNTIHVKDESDFWGLGPRAGLDTKWYLCGGFNIYGNVSGALLYGHNDVDHHEKYSLTPDVNRISLSANRHQFVPTAQLQLGLGYDRSLNCKKQHIGVRIGYDANYFWRVNQMIQPLSITRFSEDVAMYGLMIDARISF